MHKARWFAISQTIGGEYTAPSSPEWDAELAVAALDIEQIAFTDTDGNSQGSRGSARCQRFLLQVFQLSKIKRKARQ
jgi:hypothetical protein